ncbi:MAG: hypothetical protein EOO52_09820 [Gammaproteobacteria bacterium]|nr:MAG: hypothetical protein EOO52_09820 [Gammaproteobacteria bacterium]
MKYNANNDYSPEKHAEFINWLTQSTLEALKVAEGDSTKLRAAIEHYIRIASSANLELEEIENILGVNEPCIMDLAELSETDEEIVIDAFEQLIAL